MGDALTTTSNKAIRDDLFDAAFLRRTEHLALVARRMVTSGQRAQRRSKKIGSGIEFADHRDYAPGDEPRHIDWKVFGRTERLLLRQYEEEEDLSVYFLVDQSRSMGMAPAGEVTVFDRSLQVTAALSYISLSNLDRVAVVPFQERIVRPERSLRGKAQFFRILRQLSGFEVGGQTRINEALKDFARARLRRGLVVLISDFYDAQGISEGLRMLAYRGFEVLVVQLGDRRVLDGGYFGDLVLVDCETGNAAEVCLTPELLSAYDRACDELRLEIEGACREMGARHLHVDVAVPFDEVVMKVFRSGGFLG